VPGQEAEERWQSAAELTSQLQGIAEANLETLKAQKREKEPGTEAKGIVSRAGPGFPVAIPETPKVLSRLTHSRAWKLSFAGILLAVITGSLALWRVRQQPEKSLEKPKEISFKPLTSFSWDNPLDSAAISPMANTCLCSKGKLFVEVIRSGEKRSLALPEGFYPTHVVWFPDGTRLLLAEVTRPCFPSRS